MNPTYRLADRAALVTGAASGIGRALALQLAAQGASVALADRDTEGLDATASAIRAAGGRCSTHTVDMLDRDAVEALPAAAAAAHGGRLDLLVNNAGVALGGAFEQVSQDDFEWVIGVNFLGLVRLTRAALPLLRASDDAGLVNVSSIYGIVSPPGQAAYSASKFAVRGFSNALRQELRGSRVFVTVVHPGGVATAIARQARMGAGVTRAQAQEGQARAQRLLKLAPEVAARTILEAVQRRAPRVLVGGDARFAAWLERLMPVGHWGLLERLSR